MQRTPAAELEDAATRVREYATSVIPELQKVIDEITRMIEEIPGADARPLVYADQIELVAGWPDGGFAVYAQDDPEALRRRDNAPRLAPVETWINRSGDTPGSFRLHEDDARSEIPAGAF